MTVFGVTTSIDIDMDDVLEEMDGNDKKTLLKDLLDDGAIDEADVAEAFDEASMDGDTLVNELSERGVIDILPDTEAGITLFGVSHASCHDDLDFISKVLEAMPKYDLKKALCNALWVDNYNHESMLRMKLEKVITAK